ncbi:hypothetical protein [uncultured Brachyspira sp.]|uniref:hypothetical protein n=1 Tax=uncultured Brachyspira sp. TaxID=221953 RepID=UPI00261D4551|nr:hypothetical protein [uncultured Brachyspira sp.]
MSILITYSNIKTINNYKKGIIQKVNANIDDIEYYQYGIKKRDISYVIYSFQIDNNKYSTTNIYNGIINITNKNTKKELFYDKTSNEIIELNIKSKIFFSIFFFIFAVIILIWAVKLKQNNIHTWSKLK